MYRAVFRKPNLTTVAATRLVFGRVVSTVVRLGFRGLHLVFFMVRVRVRVILDCGVTFICVHRYGEKRTRMTAVHSLDWVPSAVLCKASLRHNFSSFQ